MNQVEKPASDEWRRAPAKKNTRRWCRGKVGVEHIPEIKLTKWPYQRGCKPPPAWALERRPQIDWWCEHERACATCGKILSTNLDKPNCPVYVALPAAP